ncbi:hypothetical protein Ddye_012393 [Dipteronia dyeriana]|uniref:Uncharacterized protein n=1 Tax=Dipteronia dyeriana TaxID=168575 RepID=A0AAD9X4E3_9ROSI|nr:hypothetical protein Ddye_012391 [Dipteronia dyeriana]KAK2652537.1 hypothetical protein Ddye_012393 [Dipteronia dyeriana]
MACPTTSSTDQNPNRNPPLASCSSSGMDFQSLAKTLTLNIPIKLDRNNFVYLEALILPAIKALELEGFINGSRPEPHKYIEVNKEVIINDEYSGWKH